MERIVIVGGGYAGFTAARELEKHLRPELRRGDVELVLVDPRPYMTYQPFLPEVVGASVEARHAAVAHRTHLRRTRLVDGTVTRIDHAAHQVVVRPRSGAEQHIDYDTVVVTAGAVTRVFPVPGVSEHGIGMKHVEEAVAIRDRLLTSFDQAAVLPAGPERRRLLTVTFVGGGFSGVEGFGELLSLAHDLLDRYPEIHASELQFHLVERSPRILPEVTDRPGRWVVSELERRGARVHLGTGLESATDGVVRLSTGESYATGLLVWTAGNAANPVVATHTDLPVDERGYVVVRPDLRVGTDDVPIDDAWAAGDGAAVPDLAVPRPGALAVPNAQHAVRQSRRLARNLAATLRGRRTRPYVHGSLGVIATLGLGSGVFELRRLVVRGRLAWMMHRGYHVLAIPTWERKARVLAVWLTAAVFGRDVVSLTSVQRPRAAFVAAAPRSTTSILAEDGTPGQETRGAAEPAHVA
ncbi:NADH dehydrogenase [Isoptericola sp. CG 20/1183]|uniref:NADH dehydrogenase n=1 Tax=Isoptericola halotolerans TaxID=300560 RepID=A0ABX5EDP2_9MICO|nr:MULTISPECIES: NAD(P)/FAD-dependent oxidoreductase [Isoptericola]PRZ06350.1 NADH dehydrogenase [Isoptericola halotolerans]PRZ06844.1 NADH dehydrogenase [Isoptericola sp. CG 20/1183]